ncbi:MAG TPA: hypothetical protein VGG06_08010 [Thermoanaerobaculia bacterium]|jgi:hypothetical protein
MSLQLYKVLHVLGLFLVFAAVGGAIIQTVLGGNGRARKLTGIAHGVGLLIVLVSGFGALAKLGLGFPLWVVLKVVIWIVFGGVIVLIRKQPALAGFLWWALPVLGAFAGYLAIYKPF